MIQFIATLQALLAGRVERGDKGATMVEYGLMLALIAVVCLVAVTAIGLGANGMFTTIAGSL